MRTKLTLYLKLFSTLFLFYSCNKTQEFEVKYKFPFSSLNNKFLLKILKVKLSPYDLFQKREVKEFYIVKIDGNEINDFLDLNNKESIFENAGSIDISYNEKFLAVVNGKRFSIFKLPSLELIKEIEGNHPRFYRDSLVVFTRRDSVHFYDFVNNRPGGTFRGSYPVMRNGKLFYFKSNKIFIKTYYPIQLDSIILQNHEIINPDVSFDGEKICFISGFKLMVYDITADDIDTFDMHIEYGGFYPFITPPPYPRWTYDDKIIMRNEDAMYLFIPETMEIIEITKNLQGY